MSEQKLLEELLRENPAAQRKFYYAYCDRLAYVIHRYLRDKNDLEEVLQDAFLKIFTKIYQFDPQKGGLLAWMTKIAINESLMFLRRKKLVTISIDDLVVVNNHAVNDGLNNLLEEDVLKRISLLEEKYRIIFTLKYIDGYSYKEISEMLNAKEITVRKIYSRAKGKLVRKINRDFMIANTGTLEMMKH